jgi:hypothetical protein
MHQCQAPTRFPASPKQKHHARSTFLLFLTSQTHSQPHYRFLFHTLPPYQFHFFSLNIAMAEGWDCMFCRKKGFTAKSSLVRHHGRAHEDIVLPDHLRAKSRMVGSSGATRTAVNKIASADLCVARYADSIQGLQQALIQHRELRPKVTPEWEGAYFDFRSVLRECRTVHKDPNTKIGHVDYYGDYITCTEFLEGLDDGVFSDKNGNKGIWHTIVVCGPGEAIDLLRDTTISYPILIPKSTNADHNTFDFTTFLNILSTRTGVDVHEPTRSIGTLEPKHAIVRACDATLPPVKLADIEIIKANPVPAPIAAVRELAVLHEIKPIHASGILDGRDPVAKYTYTDAESMRIGCHTIATKDTWTPPHINNNHTITAINVEHGEELAILWPRVKQLYKWSTNDAYMPPVEVPPFAVALKAGDILILPSSQVQATYSLKNSLSTVTHHWDSREMDIVAMRVFQQYRAGYVLPTDLLDRLEAVQQAWDQENPAFKWENGHGAQQRFSQYLKVS